jgi:hypothetical protein
MHGLAKNKESTMCSLILFIKEVMIMVSIDIDTATMGNCVSVLNKDTPTPDLSSMLILEVNLGKVAVSQALFYQIVFEALATRETVYLKPESNHIFVFSEIEVHEIRQQLYFNFTIPSYGNETSGLEYLPRKVQLFSGYVLCELDPSKYKGGSLYEVDDLLSVQWFSHKIGISMMHDIPYNPNLKVLRVDTNLFPPIKGSFDLNKEGVNSQW